MHAHRADFGTFEGTCYALFEFCASLVIEKRHRYIIISFAYKIEIACKCYPIMVRGKGAILSLRYSVIDLPGRNKLCNISLPSHGLYHKLPNNCNP